MQLQNLMHLIQNDKQRSRKNGALDQWYVGDKKLN